MREVKYLRQQDSSNRTIPTSADSVFAQCDTFRKFLQNLDVTVVLYNQIDETILDVEYPLIEGKLTTINEQLEKAISQLNWTSDGTHLHISLWSVICCEALAEIYIYFDFSGHKLLLAFVYLYMDSSSTCLLAVHVC